MARIGKVILLIVVLVALAAMGYGAQNLAVAGWNSVAEYESPYLAQLPRGNTTTPLAQRVVLIVVDGLRLDASRKMPFLNDLRKQGADLSVRVGQPSLSYPGWTVIVSGAWQEISGVTTNWYEGEAKVDTIFKVAKDSGLPSVAVGSPGWKKLYGSHATEVLTVEEPEETAPPSEWAKVDEKTYQLGSEVLDEYDTGFILIHFVGTDALAHNFGGVSKEYTDEAIKVDGYIKEFLKQLDFDKDVLIITADHGHIDTGGHGGWEEEVLRVPLVMVGKAIRKGVYTEQTQADIAPTVAALLGLPDPVHSQGRPLLEMIEATAEEKGRKGLNAALQLVGFYDAYAQSLGAKPFAGDVLKRYRENIARGEEGSLKAFYQELTAKARAARAGRIWRERLVRFPIAFLVALVPLLYLLSYRKRLRHLLLPLVFAILYFLLYNALFFGKGYHWSLSAFNTESQIKAFFNQRILDAALSVLVAGIILAILSWKRPALETAERMTAFSFFIGYILLLQVDFFFWLHNIKFTWYLPDLKLGFKYYLDLLQMLPTGLLAPFLVILALVIRWGIRRWRGPVPYIPQPVTPVPEPTTPPGEAQVPQPESATAGPEELPEASRQLETPEGGE